MIPLKRFLKRIFFLPPLLTILIAVPSFILCFYLLAIGSHGILAYISYGLSAYSMVITVTGFTGIMQTLQSGVNNHPLMKKVRSIPVGRRFFDDVGFRTEISLYRCLFINLLYIVLKMVSGIYYRSAWFVVLSIYYIVLAVMRFLLLRHVNRKTVGKDIPSELRRYRLCGIMLLVMNQALISIVVFIVRQNRGYDYPGMLIYAMAAYTFYITVTAVVNLVKYRKHGSPVLSAAKMIDLVAAMVSMLSLTTAMLAQFGTEDSPAFRQMMTGATGGGVCAVVLGMAVFMIVGATKRLKSYKTER